MRRQRAGDAGETDLGGCARETTPPTKSEASRTARVPTNDRSTTPSVASPRSVSVPGARVDGRRDRSVRDGNVVDRSFTCGDQRGGRTGGRPVYGRRNDIVRAGRDGGDGHRSDRRCHISVRPVAAEHDDHIDVVAEPLGGAARVGPLTSHRHV